MYTPFKHQEKSIEVAIEILNSTKIRRDIIVAPTAYGKSLVIAFAAKSVNYPLIVLQPGKELLEQNYGKFCDIGGEADIFSASLKTKNLGKITFATIGSISKMVDEVKALGVKSIIVDETHLNTQSQSQIRKFIKATGIRNVLGLTATPVYLKGGLNGAELKMMTKVRGSMFKNISHVTQIKELVEKGYWSRLIYLVEDVDDTILKENSNGSDYTLESQKEYYEGNALESKIISYVDRLNREGRKSILIFVSTIEAAESLKNLIPGSRAVHNEVKAKERKEIVDGFKNLSIQVVINVNILSVGFDHPQLDAIITARSTTSISIYYQQVGRGVRIHPEKKNCRIIELSGNYKKFGKVEDLNFEYIENYGWGMFANDVLLSNYPMSAKQRPTKSSLITSMQKKRKTFDTKIYTPDKIHFGKYKGKTLSQIQKENPFYLPWMIDNIKFEGERMMVLQQQIKTILNL